MVGSPLPTSQHLTLVVTRSFFLEPVTLGAKGIDFVEHPLKQGFGSGGRSASPLELEDFPALAAYLRAHALDLAANELDIRHCLAYQDETGL
jgi:hypothetical protein